jgi:hypothetical protein
MKLIAAFILSFIYLFSAGQNQHKDSIINCMAKWAKGEEKTLQIYRTKSTVSSGKKNPPFRFSYEAHISVLDSSENGYMMRWVFHLPALLKMANPKLAEALPVYEGLKMIFTTTANGSFKELINWEEVRDAYADMMTYSLPKELSDSAKIAINKAKELFNTKAIVESALIKEIRLYHTPYGEAFTKNGIKENTLLANPFDGDPLPAEAIQKFTEINTDLDYFNASFEQQLDSTGTKIMILSFFKTLGILEDSVLKQIQESLSDFQITDHTAYHIILSSGWIKDLSNERIGIYRDTRQTESIVFKMK